ncbi:hypothetical protein [Bacillus thuringiensis]|uniref:hypothetical protein n=1 Tax=Bacillus thuringiensis TaxID=1428 RepID=UPI002AC8DA38|nr:hypothetical protein [Bacillus thuringiensis]
MKKRYSLPMPKVCTFPYREICKKLLSEAYSVGGGEKIGFIRNGHTYMYFTIQRGTLLSNRRFIGYLSA